MKPKFLACILFSSVLLLSGCDSIFGSVSSKKTYNVVVHYYDDITRNYQITKGIEVEIAMLAPSGKQIAGIYSSDELQQADWKCIVDAKNWDDNGYTDLYVRYADAITSYVHEVVFNEENPKLIDFYASSYATFTLDYHAATATQGEFLSSILCNEYATMQVHASFEGKGDGATHHNTFKSHIKVGEDTINTFEQTTLSLDNTYKTFSYYGTMSPKQLTNNSYTVKVYIGAKYGYKDYTIKNIGLSFSLIY